MSHTQNDIDKLVQQAEHETDARKLWRIFNALTDLGAWEEAKQVMTKARDAERKLAAVMR